MPPQYLRKHVSATYSLIFQPDSDLHKNSLKINFNLDLFTPLRRYDEYQTVPLTFSNKYRNIPLTFSNKYQSIPLTFSNKSRSIPLNFSKKYQSIPVVPPTAFPRTRCMMTRSGRSIMLHIHVQTKILTMRYIRLKPNYSTLSRRGNNIHNKITQLP